MTLRKLSLALVFLVGSSVVPAFAQGLLQERITFSTSAPFELKGTNVVLPAGDFVLFQIDPHDRTVFALYEEDMTHSPVAMIRTIRIYHDLGRLPGKTKVLMDDEGSPRNLAVLEGWNVPGDYGWEVVSVTPNRHALNSRLQVRR